MPVLQNVADDRERDLPGCVQRPRTDYRHFKPVANLQRWNVTIPYAVFFEKSIASLTHPYPPSKDEGARRGMAKEKGHTT